MNSESNEMICIAGVDEIGTLMATIIGQKYAKNLSVLARNKETRRNKWPFFVP
jgi:hypothetical protein